MPQLRNMRNRSMKIDTLYKIIDVVAANASAITESNIINCKTQTWTLMQTLIYGWQIYCFGAKISF